MAGVEDRDFGGEVLGLENDGGREVGEGAVVRHFPSGFHGLGRFAEQGLVALAADDGEVVVAAGLLEDDDGEFLLGGTEFFPGKDALGFQQAFLDQLRPARLDGKVGLGEGDFLLPGIAILSDEVAGVAGEQDILDFPLRAFGQLDRFVDVNKMIGDGKPGNLTGGFRLGHGGLVKVPPLGVSEQMLDVPGEPVFDARFSLLGVGLEGGGERLNDVGIHAARSSMASFTIIASSSRVSLIRTSA